MKNINRDYLITVDVKTAKMTPAPKDMKFFMTDVYTSNIFFRLEGLETFIDASTNDKIDEEVNGAINDHFKENADDYILTLRVVKPNNEPKEIEVKPLENNIYIADLTTDFVDIPGFYDCELFIDTTINRRTERSTTDPFEYEVKKSIFYDLDDIIDTKYISIDNIATIDYVNKVTVGDVSLDGYATTEQLNTKADEEHVHDEYITQAVLDEALAGVGGCADVDLVDLVVGNSISIKRKAYSPIGECSTAEGFNTTASGRISHAEGYYTTASNYCSHAEGFNAVASGDTSHAEGCNTVADGFSSHAEGYNTVASGRYQHVQGKYNIEDGNVYAHIVGNGTSSAPSNAHTLDWEGNAWFAGDVYVGANNRVLTTKEYVDDKLLEVSNDVSYNDIELRNLINDKADEEHTHDDYITQTKLDESLGNVLYDDTELRNLINSKADRNNSELYGRVSIGENCVAGNTYTVAIGEGAYCGSMNQIAMGSWNVIDEANKYAFIFGDGDYYDDTEYRSNCMTIDRRGNCWHKGNIYVGSNSHDGYSKKVLTEGDIYFDSSGYLVVTIGNKTKRFAPVG